MKCYTYRLTLVPDPRYYYFGVRNIYKKEPQFDGYYGSGNGLEVFRKLYGKDCFRKEVLKIFADREECLQEERRLVGDLWATDPFCINKMPGGAFDGNFDTSGKRCISRSGELRYISPESVQSFLDQGWKLGLPSDAKQKLLGRICVYKGDRERNIFRSELEDYLAKGWQIGRSPRARRNLCRIHLTDGTQDMFVRTPEELEYWEKRGWYRGHSKEHTRHSAESQKGMIWVSRGQELARIRPEDLEQYKATGWQPGNSHTRGRKQSRERRESISRVQKGRIWINDGTQCKHVWPAEKEHYLTEGWSEGRLAGQVPDTSGRIRITRGSERKAVKPEDLESYRAQGWTRGRGW